MHFAKARAPIALVLMLLLGVWAGSAFADGVVTTVTDITTTVVTDTTGTPPGTDTTGTTDSTSTDTTGGGGVTSTDPVVTSTGPGVTVTTPDRDRADGDGAQAARHHGDGADDASAQAPPEAEAETARRHAAAEDHDGSDHGSRRPADDAGDHEPGVVHHADRQRLRHGDLGTVRVAAGQRALAAAIDSRRRDRRRRPRRRRERREHPEPYRTKGPKNTGSAVRAGPPAAPARTHAVEPPSPPARITPRPSRGRRRPQRPRRRRRRRRAKLLRVKPLRLTPKAGVNPSSAANGGRESTTSTSPVTTTADHGAASGPVHEDHGIGIDTPVGPFSISPTGFQVGGARAGDRERRRHPEADPVTSRRSRHSPPPAASSPSCAGSGAHGPRRAHAALSSRRPVARASSSTPRLEGRTSPGGRA